MGWYQVKRPDSEETKTILQLHLIGMKVCACCSVLREAALFYEYESCPFLLSKIAFPPPFLANEASSQHHPHHSRGVEIDVFQEQLF